MKIGATAANQTWDYSSMQNLETETRWGFTGSAFVELVCVHSLSLVAEAQYTQKGMSFSVMVTSEQNPDGIGEIITKRPRVDYLSIPLLAKFRFETSVLTPYLIAGPRYDVLLGRHGEGFQAVIDDFRRTEFGATIGAGVELRALFPFDALIEFRYNASFERAYKTNYLSVRNRTLDLMLGLSI